MVLDISSFDSKLQPALYRADLADSGSDKYDDGKIDSAKELKAAFMYLPPELTPLFLEKIKIDMTKYAGNKGLLKKADQHEGDKGNNGVIDTKEEFAAILKELPAGQGDKFVESLVISSATTAQVPQPAPAAAPQAAAVAAPSGVKGILPVSDYFARITGTWKYAEAYYFKAINVKGGKATFVVDPSQGEQIVSEGQAYWMLIGAKTARLDSKQAPAYQDRFDQILKGTQAMIALAKESGNAGSLPAWVVRIEGDRLVLDSRDGAANSSSDADFDLISALLDAQENVEKGIWKDHGYDKLIKKFLPVMKNLFEQKNGVWVMKPSEDWNDYSRPDYSAPATCFKLAEFCRAHGLKNEAAFWVEAGKGSYLTLYECIKDTGEVPASADIFRGSEYDGDLKVTAKDRQGWDGVRGAWRLAAGLRYVNPNADQLKTFEEYLKGWNGGYTDTATDAAMYLPLAFALGKSDLAKKILRTVDQATSSYLVYAADPKRYYQTTLILLSLLDLVSTPPATASKFKMPELIPQKKEEKEESAPAGSEKKVMLLSANGEWSKPGKYSVSGNSLTVKGAGKGDADAIRLGQIDTRGYSKLVVKVVSKEGDFAWGGKMFGVFGLEPDGRGVTDDFILGSLGIGDEVVFAISGKKTINLKLKVFIADGVRYKLEFTLRN